MKSKVRLEITAFFILMRQLLKTPPMFYRRNFDGATP